MKIYAVISMDGDKEICCICSNFKAAEEKREEYLDNWQKYFDSVGIKRQVNDSKFWIEELDTDKKIIWEG